MLKLAYTFDWDVTQGPLPMEPKEDDKGILEYKLHLIDLDEKTLAKRSSQM